MERLGLPFEAISPDIDESPKPGESPDLITQRLAREKAFAVLFAHPSALVIGSDQLAALGATPLGKPGSLDKARAQLQALSGKTVTFFTALAVVDGSSGRRLEALVPSTVNYRTLTDAEIDRYLAREPAIDCAGAAKIESLGIALTASVHSDDPTALTGLPLIKTVEFLNALGIPVP